MTRWPLALWIVVVWVALWGGLSVANVLGGAAVAAVLLAVFPAEGRRQAFVIRPLPALQFTGRFVVDLVRANAEVAWEVLTPSYQGDPGVVSVRLAPSSDALVTLVADAVTLTPGTLTLDVERTDDGGAVLYVHVLHLHDPHDVRDGVRRLQYLAARAFDPDPAAAAAADPRRRDPRPGPREVTS